MTGVVKPFRFEREFDAACSTVAEQDPAADGLGVVPEAIGREAPEPARAENAQTLDEVRAKAYAEGLSEGEAAAGRAMEAEALRLARSIAEALPPVAAAIERQAMLVQAHAGAFVADVVAKLLPGLENELGRLRLERFVQDALRSAPRSVTLEVRVAPADLDGATAALERLGGLGGAELRPDARMEQGHVTVSWEQGGMALEPGRVAAAIVDACAALAGPRPVRSNAAEERSPHASPREKES